jgi:hypothetical protein
VADDTTTQALLPRRRVRPYLNWLERSRESWKGRAVKTQAEVLSLRRQVRRLTASRDRWRQKALDLGRSLRQARQEQEKNRQGS